MQKPPNTRGHLQDILLAIENCFKFTQTQNFDEFLFDEKTNSATIYQLLIIGEATKRLDENFRKQHDEVPWKDMTGMRDVLIHFYHGVDYGEVWRTVEEDLPILKSQIEKIISRMDKTSGEKQ